MRASFAIQVTLLLAVTLYFPHVASWAICPFKFGKPSLNSAMCSGICQLSCYNLEHSKQKGCLDHCIGEHGLSRSNDALYECSGKCDKPDKTCRQKGHGYCENCFDACNDWFLPRRH